MAKNYIQGRYEPKNKVKYTGITPIIFRSSWEQKFMVFLDTNPSVMSWKSESIIVPYANPIKKRVCLYIPDFYFKMKDKWGNLKEYLVEIKPYGEVSKPKRTKNKKASSLLYEELTFAVNTSKWLFAEEYCKQRGWVFKIVTERDLFNLR